MSSADFTPDYAFTDALIRAIAARGPAYAPRVTTRTAEQRGARLPGVYATSRGLYARFSRRIDGKLTYFYVATGAMGDFSKDEEQRLHALWAAASAAWDAERRGNEY